VIFRATGYLSAKVGKIIAVSVGGSIILLQIAANEGYIQIDWNKITKKANKLADKAEEAISGEGPSWADKVSESIEKSQ
jgi:FUN14 domain-containing protein 1